MSKVCVIGLGYIGLPTSVVLGQNNFQVLGVDLNKSVIEKINKAIPHIVEPGIDAALEEVISTKRFKASLNPDEADTFIICVPTPFKNSGLQIPEPDIGYVMSAVDSIKDYLKKDNLIILESTSPVGTTELIEKKIREFGFAKDDIKIAYCPERVLPGNILFELLENDRVVGGINHESTDAAVDFYRSFIKGKVHKTDSRTAEMCKLTENSFRDVNIAFANELSIICEKQSINPWKLISLANRHPRVNILEPGAGVGGHCISVDPWFIVSSNPKDSDLIHTARKTNLNKTEWVLNKIKKEHNLISNINGSSIPITLYGLAFKPNIDDLRESPAVQIANSLVNDGYEINIVEPNILSHDKFKLVTINESINLNSLKVFLVKHDKFKDKIEHIVNCGSKILDFCGITNE